MEEKILFCDIDDVLINSSDFIQDYVDKNTVFKTSKLQIIEQQKRNCQYYVNCVQKECENAFLEKRLPNLQDFPNMEEYDTNNLSFDNLDSTQMKRFFKEPISTAKNYLKIADDILNQFLEERDMFLELDNLPYGGRKKYNYEAEKAKVEKFKEDLRNSRIGIEKINHFCYNEVTRISSLAMEKGVKPIYGDLIKMDKNDIIRTEGTSGDFIEIVYLNPCKEVLQCITDSPLEYALENLNIRESMSQEIVNYDFIYTESHVDKDAIFAIKSLMSTNLVDRICFITHHNGIREERAKRILMQRLFPGTDFLGLRFHSEEHNLERRKRSSKFDKAYETYGISKENMILLDDSRANCDNWHEKEGKVILYRKITPAEKVSGKEVFPYDRITDFDYLASNISKNINKEKVKKLERK